MTSFKIHRVRQHFVVLLALALLPAVVGCESKTDQSNAGVLPKQVLPTPPPQDAEIAQALEKYMKEERTLASEHVQFTVSQGIAILFGTPTTLLAKEHALRIAQMITGVRAVVDEMTVAPVTRTDAELKTDVAAELQRDQATRRTPVRVAANNGTVTLSGVADSWQEKRLFAEIAEAVKGVKSVENDVTVHYSSSRPEGEIASDVRHRIANDVWLDGRALTVGVTGGTVHVSGVVESVGQKLRAREACWVANARKVDDDGVIVESPPRDDTRQRGNYELKSDSDIAVAIRDAFRLDPRLKPLEPAATVKDGIAVLTGTVSDPKARRAAESDAMDTVGVWHVRDEVIVAPLGKPTDEEIDRAAQRAFAEDPALRNSQSIAASTSHGAVALSGSVASPFERLWAVDDVRNINGVVEVDDQLTVKLPVAEIQQNIERHLFWDPMVERSRVTVAVAPDGTATLTGTLNSWSEIKSASADAVASGATRTVNLLKLAKHPEVAAR